MPREKTYSEQQLARIEQKLDALLTALTAAAPGPKAHKAKD